VVVALWARFGGVSCSYPGRDTGCPAIDILWSSCVLPDKFWDSSSTSSFQILLNPSFVLSWDDRRNRKDLIYLLKTDKSL
jgi:hypothetical protein